MSLSPSADGGPPAPPIGPPGLPGRAVLEVYQGGWLGGTAAYLETLLPALPAAGYRAVYAALPADAGVARMASRGVATVDLPSPWAVRQAARAQGAALVHSHGVRMNAFARLAGVPQVVTVHSRLENDYRSRARMGIARAVQGPGLAGARAVIAISEAVRGDLLARGVPANRIHVVESGIDPPPTAWSRAALERAFALAPGTAVIGTVARLHPVKGLDTLIDALALVAKDPAAPPFVQLFLGDGPERAALVERARRAGLDDRMRWLGYRPDARAIVGALDLFVLPSRAEGFGLAALEAMAAGIPVVATAAGNLPALLDGGRLGRLVPVDDAPALAAAIAQGLAGTTADRERAQAARERYLKDYSGQAMARRTAAVFDAVLAGTAGAAGR